MSKNSKDRSVGQAELVTCTPAEAPPRFPGHLDCLRARLAVVAYIVVNGARHYKLRCLACQRMSRASLPQCLSDYTIRAETPAVRSASASDPGFFCEHCGAAGVETHHWAPRSLFRDFNTWPTACPARHALLHEAMRAGSARL